MKFIVFVEQCRVTPNHAVLQETKKMMGRLFPNVDIKRERVLRVEEIEDDEMDEGDLLFFANFVVEFESSNIQTLIPFNRQLDDYGIRILN